MTDAERAPDPSARNLGLLTALLFALIWRVWTAAPEWAATPLLVLLVAGIIATTAQSLWQRRGDRQRLGISPATWRSGWGALAIATALGLALLGAFGLAFGEFSLDAARLEWVFRYATGLVAQQLLLQCVFNTEFERVARRRSAPQPKRWAALRATFLFSAFHAPNPVLMIGTALAGWVWTRHFHRHHNLPALLLSHAILGVAAMISLGPGPMLDLRVGPSALRRLAELFA